MPVVRTLGGPVTVEPPRIQGSRFVARAAPAPDEATARAVVAETEAAWPDASHHCWAWRGHGDLERSSDAGEPGGTAGEPILRRIVGADLRGVVVVVSRWFGGTKLGMGGLVRAYGGAAAAALEAADITEERVCRSLTLVHDYGLSGPVAGVLSAYELEPTAESYGAEVELSVAVPIEQVDAFVADLRERTAGKVVVRGLDGWDAPVARGAG